MIHCAWCPRVATWEAMSQSGRGQVWRSCQSHAHELLSEVAYQKRRNAIVRAV